MIHPSFNGALMNSRIDLKSWLLYYILSLVLAVVNFSPLLADTPLHRSSPPHRTIYYLIMCYTMSLPLVFEFLLDFVVSILSTSSRKVMEPKVGYVMIILAMLLPVCIVSGPLEDATTPYSAVFVNCFMSFLQNLILIGLFDKLLFRTKGHWTVRGCLSVLVFFVASQVCLNLGVLYGPVDMDHLSFTTRSERVKWLLCSSIVSGIICFVLHNCLSKKYLKNFYSNGFSIESLEIDDYVSIVLQFIAFAYFVVNFSVSISLLVDRYDFNRYVNIGVISHIILGLCAAILPGRVVRKHFLVLQDLMAIKETFIRYVSHELRSPLTTTSLGLNYLLDKLHGGEIQESEILEVVQDSVVTCELAMNTLNDFLMLDKIQSNMLEINTSTYHASEFVMEAIRPFSLQASSANITLSCNVESFDGVSGRDVSVEIDSFKMHQVMRNLLSNAVKFTSSGGSVSVSMTIHEYDEQQLKLDKKCNAHTLLNCVDGHCNTVRFAVSDSGCGISATNLPKLFGQYVQFDAAKLQGGKGSGLGLWLSKSIVEMHGGKIGAESEGEGKGCTFWFELPCVLSEADRIAQRNHRATFVRKSFSVTSRSGPQSITVKTVDDCELVDLEHDEQTPDNAVKAARSFSDTALRAYQSHGGSQKGSLKTSLASPASVGSELQQQRKFVDIMPTLPKNKGDKYKASPPPTAGSRRQPLKVLLVDDSNITRKLVERSLASIGAQCTHARNGREAMEKVQQSMEGDVEEDCGFDVILMDHYMPEMTGPEAVEVIRDKLGFRGVIMGVSGNASTDTEFDALFEEGRINKVLIKPFNLDVFVDFMRLRASSDESDQK